MALDFDLMDEIPTRSTYNWPTDQLTTRDIDSSMTRAFEALLDYVSLTADDITTDIWEILIRKETGGSYDTASAALAILEAAALVGDARSFVQSATKIDWADYGPDEIAYAVRLALEAEAYPTARSLAAKGHALHPEDAELTKLDHVLAPPVSRVVPADRNEQAGRRATSQWLKEHHNAYQGQWVAVKDGKLLAAADSADEIRSKLGDMRNTGILLTYLW